MSERVTRGTRRCWAKGLEGNAEGVAWLKRMGPFVDGKPPLVPEVVRRPGHP
jgi:hypothetical protein